MVSLLDRPAKRLTLKMGLLKEHSLRTTFVLGCPWGVVSFLVCVRFSGFCFFACFCVLFCFCFLIVWYFLFRLAFSASQLCRLHVGGKKTLQCF